MSSIVWWATASVGCDRLQCRRGGGGGGVCFMVCFLEQVLSWILELRTGLEAAGNLGYNYLCNPNFNGIIRRKRVKLRRMVALS